MLEWNEILTKSIDTCFANKILLKFFYSSLIEFNFAKRIER